MGILGNLFGGKDNSNSDQRSHGGSYIVEDTAVALCLENGAYYGITKGTVLHVKV
ncbi:MAG: hypothetical protein J6X66_13700 [Lachnospiraceae bacterium]|nr:hypothetical protein [Lachnospiraceae bacterium]